MTNKFTAAVIAMAVQLAAEPHWQLYARCLEVRAGGTFDKDRKAAFEEAAGSFVKLAQHWAYEERKRFILCLMHLTGNVLEQIGSARNSDRGRSFMSPKVVIDAVLLPTLDEWQEREPDNPEPCFWIGLYAPLSWRANRNAVTDLREALRLDPGYIPAREALARCILGTIDYNQHELPSGVSMRRPRE